MMNLGAAHATRVIDRVQAVALCEPVVERPRLRAADRAGGPIANTQLSRTTTRIGAAASVLKRSIGGGANAHVSAEVRKEIHRPRRRDGERASGLEAEEIHAGLVA